MKSRKFSLERILIPVAAFGGIVALGLLNPICEKINNYDKQEVQEYVPKEDKLEYRSFEDEF